MTTLAEQAKEMEKRLREADVFEKYSEESLKDEYRGQGHRVWAKNATTWLYPEDRLIQGQFDPSEVAYLISQLAAENEVLRKDEEGRLEMYMRSEATISELRGCVMSLEIDRAAQQREIYRLRDRLIAALRAKEQP
ncbi:MAG: hypothetical protein ACYDB1_00665 [Acidiferrobacteraceae bacterium]